VVELVEHGARSDDPEVAAASAVAAEVVANHHNLLLALPGSESARTAADRERLATHIERARGHP
jgi:hypothetical protein